jgi:FkbM family methyltransferase
MINKSLKNIIEKFPKLAHLYRSYRDLLDRNSKSIFTPWGFKMAGQTIMATGDYEHEETLLFRRLLSEVDIFINVGANVGYYCCHALSLNKEVVAVEPIHRNLHYLLRNITENGWANQTEIFPLALGANTNILNIWGGGTGASLIKGWAGIPESYVNQVPVLTLDRILGTALKDKKSLILVDIEGAEYAMLEGASRTLQHVPRPIWMMEIVTTEHQPKSEHINPYLIPTFELFFDNGYTASLVDKVQTPITMTDVKKVYSGEGKFEKYNFIFR